MNVSLLIASATLFLIGAMHTVLGEWKGRRMVRRIVRSGLFDAGDALDVLAKQVVRLAWHLTSVTWCGIAAALTYLSFAERTRPVVVTIRILAITFLFHSLLSLMLARGRHPSWYLFAIVSVFSFIGTLTAAP